jgi:phosphoglucomutase
MVWNPEDPDSADKAGFPTSDVIQWYLEDGTLVTVRPSGTEPKIKFYILARTEVDTDGLGIARTASAAKTNAIEADIRKVIG